MRTDLLGASVQDRVTGATGIVTAVAAHITGETKVLIELNVTSDGRVQEPVWVDILRIGIDKRSDKFELSTIKSE